MAAIYCADVWCDDCAQKIKHEIATELWNSKTNRYLPDGTNLDKLIRDGDCSNAVELFDILNEMDERDYDSDEFPKGCDDDEESDCPQHCAAGEACENAVECSDGEKYGYFFGNSLTSEGDEYVKEIVRENLSAGRNDSPAVEIWKPCYDYIDYGVEAQCATCGDWASLDDWDECDNCQSKRPD